MTPHVGPKRMKVQSGKTLKGKGLANGAKTKKPNTLLMRVLL